MKSVRAIALVFLVLLISGSVAHAEDSVQLPEKKNFHLFLLVGQSNMPDEESWQRRIGLPTRACLR